MSHYNVKPVEADLAPSRLLKRLLIGMHGLCLVPVFLLPIHPAGIAVLSLVLAASLIHSVRQLPGALRGLSLAMDGTFSVRLKTGAWAPAEVLESSFVSPWLTVLHLRVDRRRSMLPLVLFSDMLAREDFRRLRLWLLWGWKQKDET